MEKRATGGVSGSVSQGGTRTAPPTGNTGDDQGDLREKVRVDYGAAGNLGTLLRGSSAEGHE